MVLTIAVCVGLAASPASAAPVFLGTAARDGASELDRAAIDRALSQAFQSPGSDGATTTAPSERAGDVASLLEEARAVAAKKRWAQVLTLTAKALVLWESGPAFSDDDNSKGLGRALLSLRADAALGAKKKKIASTAAQALLTIDPSYSPPKGASKPLLKLFVAARRDTKLNATLAINGPPGAEAIVDGQRRGTTPVVLDKLAAGAHYVAVVHEGQWHTKRMVLRKGRNTFAPSVKNEPRQDASDVLALIQSPIDEQQLVAGCGALGDDVVIAVVMPASAGLEVISVRVHDERVVSVHGASLGPTTDRDHTASDLAKALADSESDSWVDNQGRGAEELRTKLFSRGTGAAGVSAGAVDDGEEGAVSPLVITAAVIGGVAAVAALGGAAAFVGYGEYRRNTGFKWSVDASKL
jgi:hypothetical protein